MNNKHIANLLVESAELLNESFYINSKGEKVPKECKNVVLKLKYFYVENQFLNAQIKNVERFMV